LEIGNQLQIYLDVATIEIIVDNINAEVF